MHASTSFAACKVEDGDRKLILYMAQKIANR
jgi:hypothetical protein